MEHMQFQHLHHRFSGRGTSAPAATLSRPFQLVNLLDRFRLNLNALEHRHTRRRSPATYRRVQSEPKRVVVRACPTAAGRLEGLATVTEKLARLDAATKTVAAAKARLSK